ncbi:MAG: hypothetical protein OSB18_07015, partial [SAR324 cluster bacterium]|nr:hypothetical protein [SAR324 cluster bacterium]
MKPSEAVQHFSGKRLYTSVVVYTISLSLVVKYLFHSGEAGFGDGLEPVFLIILMQAKEVIMQSFQSFSKRVALGIIGVGVSLGLSLTPVMAKDITIQVWAGGSNVNDSYRVDAIAMAADILEKEAAILGEDLNITVET